MKPEQSDLSLYCFQSRFNTKVQKQMREQMTNVLNGGKRVNLKFY